MQEFLSSYCSNASLNSVYAFGLCSGVQEPAHPSYSEPFPFLDEVRFAILDNRLRLDKRLTDVHFVTRLDCVGAESTSQPGCRCSNQRIAGSLEMGHRSRRRQDSCACPKLFTVSKSLTHLHLQTGSSARMISPFRCMYNYCMYLNASRGCLVHVDENIWTELCCRKV